MKTLMIPLLFVASLACEAEEAPHQQRKQLFKQIDHQHDELKELLADQQWQQASTVATGLANDVQQLQQLFPAQSAGKGRSRAAVWERWDDFSARLRKLENAYSAIATSAAEGHLDEAARFEALSSCRSCHKQYRSLW